MCGRNKRTRSSGERRDGQGYEGETIRFDRQGSGEARTYARMQHFPWWTLWLIWPLIGVIKATTPLVIGTLGAWSQITVPLLPLVLIAIGVILLLRHRGQ